MESGLTKWTLDQNSFSDLKRPAGAILVLSRHPQHVVGVVLQLLSREVRKQGGAEWLPVGAVGLSDGHLVTLDWCATVVEGWGPREGSRVVDDGLDGDWSLGWTGSVYE